MTFMKDPLARTRELLVTEPDKKPGVHHIPCWLGQRVGFHWMRDDERIVIIDDQKSNRDRIRDRSAPDHTLWYRR
jgi:hypothetical protein